jgi:hypothetical protein
MNMEALGSNILASNREMPALKKTRLEANAKKAEAEKVYAAIAGACARL